MGKGQIEQRTRDKSNNGEEQKLYVSNEFYCERDGMKIFGVIRRPPENGRFPLIILSHELGATHATMDKYARFLSNLGIATYTFDFNGGAIWNRSDGETTDMSLLTEAADLEAVIEQLSNLDFVDENKIILYGGSMGAVVSAITASRLKERIYGLVLMYPATVLVDDAHSRFKTKDRVPGTCDINGWITVGSRYFLDIWDMDIYSEMTKFDKKVLIVHGSSDNVVPISYSIKLNKLYNDSQLIIIKGADHLFHREEVNEMKGYAERYLEEISILHR